MSVKKKIGKPIALVLITCVLLLLYSFIEPYWIEIKRSTFYSKDLPYKFDGLKIVFISDIHHGPFLSKSRVQRVVKLANSLKPDLILLGGDYVHKNQKYFEPCFEELKKLRAPLGRYGVLGNHDHWEGEQLCKKWMKNAGIGILDNASAWIYRGDQRIKIGGVGDMVQDSQGIIPTVQDVKDKDFVILLSHSPDYVEFMKTDKVDLMLSGHTHGGQCALFGLWAPINSSMFGNKYRTGVFKTAKTTLLVTNGIGTISPPVRFFARPQVNVIYLRKEHD
jgi:uncharacterized protein